MRKIVLTVLATTILAAAMPANRATAMPLAMPAAAVAPLTQKVTVVCGNNGCAAVQTHRVEHRKYHH